MGGAHPGVAQSTADAYFHAAAKEYVAGNSELAMQTVEQGLEISPSNPKLVALREKLQQTGRSQGSGNESRDSPSDDSQSQSEGSSNDSSADGRESPLSAQSEAERGNTGTSPFGQGGTRSSRARPPGSEQGDPLSGSRGAGRPVDTLSRMQAERLLRALESQERRLLRQIQIRSTESRTVENDW